MQQRRGHGGVSKPPEEKEGSCLLDGQLGPAREREIGREGERRQVEFFKHVFFSFCTLIIAARTYITANIGISL